MNKLPVGDAIRFAYHFTFGQIGAIIGLVWIPALIIVVGSYFTVQPYYAAALASMQGGPLPSGVPALAFILFQIVSLLLVACIMVSITQQAMGLRQGQPLAHFALGPTELRVYAGMIGLFLLFLIFMLCYAMGFGAAAVVAKLLAPYGSAGLMGGEAIVVIYAVAGLAAFVYVMTRLSFVFVPAALTDGGFGIARSWEVTRGNFWRIFAIGCATVLPMMLLVIAAEVEILGPHFFIPDLASLTDKAAQARSATAQMAAVQENMPYLLGLGFVITPVLYGLLLSPAAFAWRSLTASTGPTPAP